MNKNPGAPNDDIERLKMRKEVLWGLFEEHRAHARHIETLRSAVISMLIVASAVLATLSTYDKKLNTSDLPAAGLLVGFGILGTVFSFYHTEKITKHNMRAAEYRNELESTVFGNPEGGELATIDDRADAAFSALLGDRTDRNKFMQLIVFAIKQIDIILPRGLFLWSLLPLFISLIGLLLIVLIAPIVGELALVVCLLGLLIGLLFFAQRR